MQKLPFLHSIDLIQPPPRRVHSPTPYLGPKASHHAWCKRNHCIKAWLPPGNMGRFMPNSLRPVLRTMSLALPAWKNNLMSFVHMVPQEGTPSHHPPCLVHNKNQAGELQLSSRGSNFEGLLCTFQTCQARHHQTTMESSTAWCPETPTLNSLRDLLPTEGGMRLREQLNAWTMAGYPDWSIGRYGAIPQPWGRSTTPMCLWNVFTDMQPLLAIIFWLQRTIFYCGDRIQNIPTKIFKFISEIGREKCL